MRLETTHSTPLWTWADAHYRSGVGGNRWIEHARSDPVSRLVGSRLGTGMRRIRSRNNKKEFRRCDSLRLAFAGPGTRSQLSGAKDVQPAGRLAPGSFSYSTGIVPDPILVQLLLPGPTTCRPDNALLPAARDNPQILKYYVINRG